MSPQKTSLDQRPRKQSHRFRWIVGISAALVFVLLCFGVLFHFVSNSSSAVFYRLSRFGAISMPGYLGDMPGYGLNFHHSKIRDEDLGSFLD